jgi:AcrR family transcriptional regulator
MRGRLRGVSRPRLSAPERRAELHSAALAQFAARGYHGTSIDDIATTAGISKALIYEHFASKRELHDELLAEHAGELFARFRSNAQKGAVGEERLRGGVDAFFSFVEERREAWRALFRDQADPELAPMVDRLQEQAAAVIMALTAADPTAPKLDPRAAEMLARLLSGACQGLANWWLEHPDVPRAELVDRVVDFCWVGLDRLR